MVDLLNTTTSHLEAFRLRKFSLVNFVTREIWASRVVGLEASVRMSSACRYPPAYVLFTEAPIDWDWRCLRRGSMTSRNRAGERMDPCLTPRPRGKEEETCYLRRMELRQSVYQLRNIRHVLAFTPMSNSLFNSTGNSTESKAFCRPYCDKMRMRT